MLMAQIFKQFDGNCGSVTIRPFSITNKKPAFAKKVGFFCGFEAKQSMANGRFSHHLSFTKQTREQTAVFPTFSHPQNRHGEQTAVFHHPHPSVGATRWGNTPSKNQHLRPPSPRPRCMPFNGRGNR